MLLKKRQDKQPRRRNSWWPHVHLSFW